MILLLGGTTEGRQLAEALVQEGTPLIVSKATSYPQGLGGAQVIEGPLERDDLAFLIRSREVRLVVDATHPYAARISSIAMEVCKEEAVPYLRFERFEPPLPREPFIQEAASFEEAARLAARGARTMLLTTGVSSLVHFKVHAAASGCRIVARILPREESIKQCLDAGLQASDIITGLGPFSLKENLDHIKRFNVDVLVTKSSGTEGGLPEKVEAARLSGCRLVVVVRPRLNYPTVAYTVEEALVSIEKMTAP
jgi:precorrin-6A/cobalt-precorrin-6A reductase